MRTTYILDTSVLVEDPSAYKQFYHSDVVIPITVLNELDKLKKDFSDAAKKARLAIRLLDELSELTDIGTGVLLKEQDVLVKVDATYYDLNSPEFAGFGDPTYGDTQILACAVSNLRNHPTKDVVFVSNDINLRVKAKARGLDSISHEGAASSFSELYSGVQVVVDENAGLDLQKNNSIDPRLYNLKLQANECVLFKNESGDGIAMGRKVSFDKIKPIKKHYPWSISPRNKEQTFAIDLLMDKNVDLVTLIGKAGSGKAQPLDAEVLTPHGFRKMGDLKVGDLVSTPDGKSAPIIEIFPQGEKDIYKVSFSDGTSTECCEDHLWLTKNSQERNYKKEGKIRNTKEIKETLFYGVNKKKNHSIPITKSIEFSKKNLPIKPYTFGALLGDGSFRNQLNITTGDEEIINLIDEELKEVNLKIKKILNKKYHYDIVGLSNKIKNFKKVKTIDSLKNEHEYNSAQEASLQLNCSLNKIYKALAKNKEYFNLKWSYLNKSSDNVLLSYLRKVGLWMKKSEDKFIPDEYKYSSISDRVELLQGLLDTDGTISKLGEIQYYTVSKKLAEDFRWIVESLGGTASTKIKKASYKKNGVKNECKDCYKISVVLPNEIVPFKLKRKINRIVSRSKYFPRRYVVGVDLVSKKQAQCILIDHPDHLYITNNCIVTHNTLVTLASAIELVLNKKEYDKLIIYRPIQEVGSGIGYLPGDISEKLAPWFQAIMDSFEVLFSTKSGDWKRNLEMFQKKGQIEMDAIAYVRGRSIPNAIILIDEAQNLSKDEIKTLLTRAGEGTKIILTGDIEQIDNNKLDAINNGLTYTIEKFKDSELAGHITFTKGERSRLATLAANIL